MRVCNVAGCPEIYDGTQGRCPRHRREAARTRGSTHARGYSTPGHQAFRTAVITRDPICVICGTAFSTVADHYPKTRRELLELGLNPNDPARGRGLCANCHNKHTAQTSLGGFRSE